ncbi:MAG: 50S ribosomal protein L9 [Fibrobacteria bacterium]|nr:50S ribosomal protein L9 [Fibrobacteria bacterium]
MEVILKSDIKGLGKTLDLVNVKKGYAQNFLFPKQLATQATPRNKELLEKDRAAAEVYYLKERKAAESLAEELKNVSVTIPVKTYEGEKLYGSITSKEVAAKLKENGIDIERKQIDISEPIKNLGMYTIKVLLPPDIETKIKLWVISDESEKVKDPE